MTTASVDGDLPCFASLEDAIEFVARCGGGTVRTEHFDTLYAKSLKIPPNVKLVPMPAVEPETVKCCA